MKNHFCNLVDKHKIHIDKTIHPFVHPSSIMTMISRIALIACLLCSWINSANALCNLCSSGVQGIKWPFSVLDSSGTTCSQKAVEMARISNNGQCNSEINKYRSKCCGGSQPQDAEVAPTRAPSYNGPTGPYPKCDICRDGDYPGNTAMVINMLYIGYGSCAQFYDIGRAGLIQTHLCGK